MACLALALLTVAALPADAADQPLVLSPDGPRPAGPTPPWPGPLAIAQDVVVPGAASALLLTLLGSYSDNQTMIYGLLAATLVLPPAALVGWRDHPFALDSYFASVSGGVLGLAVGYGLSSLAFPLAAQTAASAGASALTGDTSGLWRLGFAALGEGLGATAGLLMYEHAKPTLADLNKLAPPPKDNPDDWATWKQRHRDD